jgi:hypothetical protein
MLAVRNSSIPGPPLGTLGPLFTFLWGVTPPHTPSSSGPVHIYLFQNFREENSH